MVKHMCPCGRIKDIPKDEEAECKICRGRFQPVPTISKLDQKYFPESNFPFKIVGIVIGSVIALILIFGTFYTIGAGERGVLLTFGKPNLDSKGEGLGLKFPLVQKIVKMDVKTQKYEADASAASKDLQSVSTKIAVNYHLLPETIPLLYQEIGKGYSDRLIQPAVQEAVKAATAEFTAEELITKRPEVKEKIKELLIYRLSSRNIIIEDISITNFDFSESFNSAIEAKVTAEQQKLKADRDLDRIRVEAEQKIAQAEAEAEALRLQKQEITPDLIRLRQIEVQRAALEKWDGKLPQVTGGAMPFFDVTTIQPSITE